METIQKKRGRVELLMRFDCDALYQVMKRLTVSDETVKKLNAINELKSKNLVYLMNLPRYKDYSFSDVLNRDILPSFTKDALSVSDKKKLSVIFTRLIDEFHYEVVRNVRRPFLLLSNLPETCLDLDSNEIEIDTEGVMNSLEHIGVKNMRDCIQIDSSTYIVLVDNINGEKTANRLNGMQIGDNLIKAKFVI